MPSLGTDPKTKGALASPPNGRKQPGQVTGKGLRETCVDCDFGSQHAVLNLFAGARVD